MNILKRFRSDGPPAKHDDARGYAYNEEIAPPLPLFSVNDMKTRTVPPALERRVYDVVSLVARSLLSDTSVRKVDHEKILHVDSSDKHVTFDYVARIEAAAGLEPCALTHEGIAANSHIDGLRLWSLAEIEGKGWSLTLRIKIVA